MPVFSVGTYKKRLADKAGQHWLTPSEIESHVFATTDLASLNQEERRRLQWIAETVVWPVTRKRRRLPNPTPTLF